jgi:glucokinase
MSATLYREMASGSIIGVDLGGTKTAIARYDAKTLALQAEERMPTRTPEGFATVLEDIVAAVERMRTADTNAVGIGVPGLVQQPAGILLKAPNIGSSDNVNVKGILTERLRLPVYVDNDANCFTLAEVRAGAAKGHKVVVGITFGTGVGGGIVIDGKIFRGANGFAAEIGHMLLVPGKPPYKTDYQRGEVEQFLSGTAFGKRCLDATDPKDYLEHGSVCSFMHPDIWREVAWLCTSISHLLDPDAFVFGGSAGYAFQPHLQEIRKEQENWMLPGAPIPDILIAELKNSATLGAALLAS